jgi:signal transduction histidine kinase
MFAAKLFRRLDERRLGLVLGVFFLALAIPAAVLIAQAYDQLKWEAFRRNQLLAEDLAARVDSALSAAVATEEARSFGDYSFLVVAGDAAANFVQRSPLSAFPVAGAVPGTLGYFQVDALGTLTTPLLPGTGVDAASYGIGADEQAARRALFATLSDVLAANRLVPRAPDVVPSEAERDAKSEREEANASRVAAPASRSSGASSSPVPSASPSPPADTVPKALQPTAPSASDSAAASAPEREQQGLLLSSLRGSGQKLQEQIAKAEQTQAAFDRLAPNAPAVQSAVDEAKGRAEPLPATANRADTQEIVVTGNRIARDPSKDVAAAAPAAVSSDKLAPAAERRKRSEQSLVAEPEPATPESARPAADTGAAAGSIAGGKVELRVRTFASELDPFEVGQLDTGQLVIFRNAWRSGQRYIQGALLDRERFVDQAVAGAFRASSLAAMSDVAVSYRGHSLATLHATTGDDYAARAGAGLAGTLLHRARLSPPFGDLELAFSVNQLPRAPGALLLLWISITLAAVLCGGFFFMYRFAVGQLRLARQQQDFVSAVSHELKTPLTSIRMYGEMLKAGWADDAKKQIYYDYIHSESERLSRLIENVLQLARLTRSSQHLDVKRATTAELVDLLRSKTATQAERAGFKLDVRDETPPGTELTLDVDAFAQIFINLVDNALKFASGADAKSVEIGARRESDGRVLFTVRDFGPGIPKGQLKKIFELFYRPEDEVTRATAGTGIGLALVRELAAALGGRVEVRNCEPGAEFRVSFPAAGPAAA